MNTSKQAKEYRLELFLSRSQRLQTDILDLNGLQISIDNLQTDIDDPLDVFPQVLKDESQKMIDSYQMLYCFENDVRQIINYVMTEKIGSDWWEKSVPLGIKEEVKKNHNKEKNSMYYGRQINDPIYFTTLGDLKEIITSNYEHFENFVRSKQTVSELLYQINRLRVVIGHNCMLEDLDIQTLKQHIERWYTLR